MGRYINYLLITDSLQLIFWIISIIISIKIFKIFKERSNKDSWYDEDFNFFMSIIMFAAIIGLSTIAFYTGLDLIKSIIVPEVRIAEIIISNTK